VLRAGTESCGSRRAIDGWQPARHVSLTPPNRVDTWGGSIGTLSLLRICPHRHRCELTASCLLRGLRLQVDPGGQRAKGPSTATVLHEHGGADSGGALRARGGRSKSIPTEHGTSHVVPTHRMKRTCIVPSCSTVLSIYNATDYCWVHELPIPRSGSLPGR